MTEREVMAELVRFVGVLTYGKERWFKRNGCWYDRMYGDHIQNETLLERIGKAIKDEVRCDSADRPIGKWIFEPKDAIELMFTKPKCSECGFESADGGNFCSNCGADMRGGEDE